MSSWCNKPKIKMKNKNAKFSYIEEFGIFFTFVKSSI